MRIGPCTLLLALSFSPALLSQTAAAQTAKTAKTPVRKSATAAAKATPAAPAATAAPAVAPACNCPATTVAQRHYPPYSVKQTTTRVQTLANGTNITTVTTSQLWRDAEGRTRQETFNTLADGTQFRSVYITDPVARLRMNWIVNNPNASKIVTVNHYPQPTEQPTTTTPLAVQRYYPTTNQSLPPQTIEGLYATGYRATRTIPAGYEGNDRDLTTTTENWSSQLLGLQLRSIIDDPRNGKTTTEYTDIQQTAPDPSLFKAPEGYQVREVNQ
jgi:hypothetical protein